MKDFHRPRPAVLLVLIMGFLCGLAAGTRTSGSKKSRDQIDIPVDTLKTKARSKEFQFAIRRPKKAETAIQKRTWIDLGTSVGTVVTGIATVIALIFTARALTIQADQFAIDQERRTSSYAKRVSFSWENTKAQIKAAQKGEMIGGSISILNANPYAINAWVVANLDDQEVDPPGHPRFLLPPQLAANATRYMLKNLRFRGEEEIPPAVHLGQLPACSSLTVDDPLASTRDDLHAKTDYPERWVGNLLFFDPQGALWLRGTNGSLKRVIISSDINERNLTVIAGRSIDRGIEIQPSKLKVKKSPFCDIGDG